MRKLTEGGGIYRYLQSVQAYVSPPIAAAFLLGIFYKKINAKGALAALWTGFALGMARLVLEYMTQEGGLMLTPGGMINSLVTMNFLHYAIFLFVVSIAVMVLVSFATVKTAKLVEPGLVYERGVVQSVDQKAKPVEVYLTIAIIIAVLILWWVFR
jgi:SSS family solute:Na+ symporter